VVTPRFLPDTGGVERHVYETARRLSARGVNVTVLTADRTRTRPRHDTVDGVAIRRVPAWPRRRDYYIAPAIYPFVMRGPWDIVHVQSWHTPVAPLAMLAASRKGTPFVVTPHGRGYASWLRRPMRPVQRRALAPLLRRASRVIALARFERDLLIGELGLSPELIEVIPNGSDLVAPADESPSRPQGLTIVSIGRLEQFKGHQRIVRALPYILDSKPDARLVIVGEGPYEAALRRLATRLGVEAAVTIRSFSLSQQQALATLVSSASLVVLLSDYETQPIAALEAAALGTPVLVADIAGMREFAEDGLGRSVPLKSTPREVARAALEQLDAPRHARLPHIPSWNDCADALLRLYSEHAGGRRLEAS
jgi:glycosyltransferase involved in cell wall biosynthesis